MLTKNRGLAKDRLTEERSETVQQGQRFVLSMKPFFFTKPSSFRAIKDILQVVSSYILIFMYKTDILPLKEIINVD